METNLACRWEGVRLPQSIGNLSGLPRSSPPEVPRRLLQNFSHYGDFKSNPESSPEVPWSSPDLPRSNQTSPDVNPISLGSWQSQLLTSEINYKDGTGAKPGVGPGPEWELSEPIFRETKSEP